MLIRVYRKAEGRRYSLNIKDYFSIQTLEYYCVLKDHCIGKETAKNSKGVEEKRRGRMPRI
jgi:tRNA U54 and U55 pseudouridine synthase Pus10